MPSNPQTESGSCIYGKWIVKTDQPEMMCPVAEVEKLFPIMSAKEIVRYEYVV
jgi:hypothetical protein